MSVHAVQRLVAALAPARGLGDKAGDSSGAGSLRDPAVRSAYEAILLHDVVKVGKESETRKGVSVEPEGDVSTRLQQHANRMASAGAKTASQQLLACWQRVQESAGAEVSNAVLEVLLPLSRPDAIPPRLLDDDSGRLAARRLLGRAVLSQPLLCELGEEPRVPSSSASWWYPSSGDASQDPSLRLSMWLPSGYSDGDGEGEGEGEAQQEALRALLWPDTFDAAVASLFAPPAKAGTLQDAGDGEEPQLHPAPVSFMHSNLGMLGSEEVLDGGLLSALFNIVPAVVPTQAVAAEAAVAVPAPDEPALAPSPAVGTVAQHRMPKQKRAKRKLLTPAERLSAAAAAAAAPLPSPPAAAAAPVPVAAPSPLAAEAVFCAWMMQAAAGVPSPAFSLSAAPGSGGACAVQWLGCAAFEALPHTVTAPTPLQQAVWWRAAAEAAAHGTARWQLEHAASELLAAGSGAASDGDAATAAIACRCLAATAGGVRELLRYHTAAVLRLLQQHTAAGTTGVQARVSSTLSVLRTGALLRPWASVLSAVSGCVSPCLSAAAATRTRNSNSSTALAAAVLEAVYIACTDALSAPAAVSSGSAGHSSAPEASAALLALCRCAFAPLLAAMQHSTPNELTTDTQSIRWDAIIPSSLSAAVGGEDGGGIESLLDSPAQSAAAPLRLPVVLQAHDTALRHLAVECPSLLHSLRGQADPSSASCQLPASDAECSSSALEAVDRDAVTVRRLQQWLTTQLAAWTVAAGGAATAFPVEEDQIAAEVARQLLEADAAALAARRQAATTAAAAEEAAHEAAAPALVSNKGRRFSAASSYGASPYGPLTAHGAAPLVTSPFGLRRGSQASIAHAGSVSSFSLPMNVPADRMSTAMSVASGLTGAVGAAATAGVDWLLSARERRAAAAAEAREVRAAAATAAAEAAAAAKAQQAAMLRDLMQQAEETAARRAAEAAAEKADDARYASALAQQAAWGASPLKAAGNWTPRSPAVTTPLKSPAAAVAAPESDASAAQVSLYAEARRQVLASFGERIAALQAHAARRTARAAAAAPAAADGGSSGQSELDIDNSTASSSLPAADDPMRVALEALASLSPASAAEAAQLAQQLGLDWSLSDTAPAIQHDTIAAHGDGSASGVASTPDTVRRGSSSGRGRGGAMAALLHAVPELESLLPPDIVTHIRVLQPSGGRSSIAFALGGGDNGAGGDSNSTSGVPRTSVKVSQPPGGHMSDAGSTPADGGTSTARTQVRITQPPGGTPSAVLMAEAEAEAAKTSVRVQQPSGGTSTLQQWLYGEAPASDGEAPASDGAGTASVASGEEGVHTSIRVLQPSGGGRSQGVSAVLSPSPSPPPPPRTQHGNSGAATEEADAVDSSAIHTSVRVLQPSGGHSSMAELLSTTTASPVAASAAAAPQAAPRSPAAVGALLRGDATENVTDAAAFVPSVRVTQPTGGSSVMQELLYGGAGTVTGAGAETQTEAHTQRPRLRRPAPASAPTAITAEEDGSVVLRGGKRVTQPAGGSSTAEFLLYGRPVPLPRAPQEGEEEGDTQGGAQASSALVTRDVALASLFAVDSPLPSTLLTPPAWPHAPSSVTVASPVPPADVSLFPPSALTLPFRAAVAHAVIQPLYRRLSLAHHATVLLLLVQQDVLGHLAALRSWMLQSDGAVASTTAHLLQASVEGLLQPVAKIVDGGGSAASTAPPLSPSDACVLANNAVVTARMELGYAAVHAMVEEEARRRLQLATLAVQPEVDASRANVGSSGSGARNVWQLQSAWRQASLCVDAAPAVRYAHCFSYSKPLYVGDGTADAAVRPLGSLLDVVSILQPSYDPSATPLATATATATAKASATAAPSVASALSSVITPSSLAAYSAVHRLLLQLRVTALRLHTAWLGLMRHRPDCSRRASQRHSARSPTAPAAAVAVAAEEGAGEAHAADAAFVLACSLRHACSHVLGSILSHLMHAVLEPAYATLLHRVRSATAAHSVQGLRALHEAYCASLLQGCMLPAVAPLSASASPAMHVAAGLLQSLLRLHWQVADALLAAWPLDRAGKLTRGNSGDSLAVLSTLQTLQRSHQQQVGYLVAGLRGMVQGSVTARAEDLLLRLAARGAAAL